MEWRDEITFSLNYLQIFNYIFKLFLNVNYYLILIKKLKLNFLK